ncbi:MAG: toxin-antitoxin system YwqK family antitoxin [Bacteroidales bacterium]|nr:toxin-antitoxin system YwqK family antitoxin [Candidatus Scybalocola fimicaballi]
MRARYFLIALSCLAMTAMAEPQNKTDKKGKKQGEWGKFYPNGNPKYIGTFKDDVPVGEFQHFYENGRPQSTQTYIDATHSKVVFYEPDGTTIQSQGSYVGKEKDGKWEYFSKGKLNLVENYKAGKKHGLQMSYNKDGVAMEEIPYVDGKIHGTMKSYLGDGKLYYTVEYVNGVKEGKYVAYDGTDKIVETGSHKKDKRDGNWVTYNDKGEVVETLIFADGVLKNAEEIQKKRSAAYQEKESQKGKIQEPNAGSDAEVKTH